MPLHLVEVHTQGRSLLEGVCACPETRKIWNSVCLWNIPICLRIVIAPRIVVYLQIMTITSLNAVESVNGCLSRQKKAVGMQRIGTKGGSGRVVQGREKSVRSTTVVVE
jgi:hypothetical protein